MIIWSGRGLWIGLFFNIIGWSIIFLTSLNESDNAPWIIACFVTAVFCFFVGRIWNYQTYESLLKKQQGENVDIIPLTSLFWIRMEHWTWILIIIGVLIWTGVFG